MRVLLSGASGFFGSHLLRHLLTNTDWTFVCPCSWRHKGTPERIEYALVGHDSNRVNVITHDLTAPFTPQTKKRLGHIDIILNIAANSHVNRSIDEPGEFIIGNTAIAYNMLELSRELRPKVFLQFSTDEVYGAAPEGVNHAEWAPIIPSNPYSASKACQEAIAISYWRTYNVPVIISNTMNVCGQTQDPEKYVAQLIRRIHSGDRVLIHGTPSNIGSRYYIHARNAADAVLFIVKNLPPKLYNNGENAMPDRYNIVGDREFNNLELANLVALIMNKPLDFEFLDFHSARSGHDRRYALDGAKLRNLGWKSPVDFETSLRKTIEWTLRNKQWL